MLGRTLILLALVWHLDQFVPGVGWIEMYPSFENGAECEGWRKHMADRIEPEHRARWYAKTRCVTGE